MKLAVLRIDPATVRAWQAVIDEEDTEGLQILATVLDELDATTRKKGRRRR